MIDCLTAVDYEHAIDDWTSPCGSSGRTWENIGRKPHVQKPGVRVRDFVFPCAKNRTKWEQGKLRKHA